MRVSSETARIDAPRRSTFMTNRKSLCAVVAALALAGAACSSGNSKGNGQGGSSGTGG